MIKRIRHIALILTLLLLGGMVNEVWAYKVTYHILTLPFTTKNADGAGNLTDRCTNIRVEAVKVVVNNTTKIGLPAHFKSPLATEGSFKYYKAHVTKLTKASPGNISADYFDASDRAQIYQYMTTRYELFVIDGAVNNGDLAEGNYNVENDVVDSDCDIYVTYTYNPSNGIAKLDGSQEYNIKLGNRFLCFNKGRANRPGAILASNVTEENLISEDFSYVATPGFDGNKHHYYHFRFYMEGNDPYNITLRSAYNGDETFRETDKALNKTVTKWYKGASLFCQGKSNGDNNLWLASDDDKQYTQTNEAGEVTWNEKPGFYRGGNGGAAEMDPVWNSFAMLNADEGSGYVFMGTKINTNGNSWQPNGDKYFYLTGENASGNNPRFLLKTPKNAESTDEQIYEIREYVYKVKTPLSNTVLTAVFKESQYNGEALLLNHVPEALNRKYAIFTGAYKDDGLTTPMTTFADAEENADVEIVGGKTRKIIWLKYTYDDMPFETLPAGSSYTDARWYTMRMNGENQYVVTYDATNNKFTTGGGSNTSGLEHQGENSAEAQVAFMGDPFELRIINRKACEDATAAAATAPAASHNRYIGCAIDAADATNFSAQTGSDDISSWEIAYDDVSGSMALRQLGTYATPKYLGWNYSDVANGRPIYYKTESSRIKVMALEKKTYVYHIYNASNQIAVKASVQQDVGHPIYNYTDIPDIIRSPFLALPGVTVKFYHSAEDALYNEGAGQNEVNYTPYNVTASTNKDIYVRYFGMSDALAAYRVHLNASQDYNVRLNGQYISYSAENDKGHINSQQTIDDEQSNSDSFVWQLLGSDPYAMTVFNKGASKFVHASQNNDAYLSFVNEGEESKFIVKSGSAENTFEVMLAVGDGVDASETYYHIGRKDANEVKVYSDDGVTSGSDAIRFRLTLRGNSAKYYNLIDKEGKILVSIRVRDDILSLPGGYWSPLVSQYHYWKTSDFDVSDGVYTLKGGATELASMSEVADATFTETASTSDAYEASEHQKTAVDVDDMRAQARALSAYETYQFRVGTSGSYTYYTIEVTAVPDRQIYVTYDVSDRVNLKKRALYLLKFHVGDNFRQEDGADDLLPDEDMSANTYRYKAVYPYCNGDCNFFVYGEEQYDLQQQGAASTRTRWAWYLESANNDPYHVKISSLQSESFNNNYYNAYFHTYLETFNDGSKHVVTNLAWPGITGAEGTEYMIVGSVGRYQLKTTETIPIDLNGDGDTDDEGESNERYSVTSFEQYWKTYDTIKNKLLAKAKDPSDPSKDLLDAEDKGASPTGAIKVVKDKYRNYLTTTFGFHSYDYYAYAKRFNGYNNNNETKKGWEQIEHWYQTVNMGDGYFDFVPVVIAPVLILLDQHGWEIMRKPLPSSDKDPNKAEKLALLSTYDSPMVKEYAFWASAKKRTGFHQYYQLDKRIGGKVNGKAFTSTSLGKLPPYGSENVLDAKGNLYDQYVTYIVKDEYASSYTYDEGTGAWVPSEFLVQQGDKFVSTTDGTAKTLTTVPTGGMSQYIIDNASISNDKLWILKPNANIDQEMGYGTGGDAPDWGSNPNAYEESDYEHETIAKYIDDKTLGKFSFSNGFDPYNIQISSAKYPAQYVVTNAIGATLEEGEGAILGVYEGAASVSLGTPRVDDGNTGTWTWYDSRRLHVTNATFMAVSDGNGHMQLMPRFSQKLRMKDFADLVLPSDMEVSKTYTQIFRPLKYTYHIIDNEGRESLRYQSGGDLKPQMPTHFKSPLAKDFTYHKTLTSTGTNTYDLSTLDDEITESETFVSKGMTASSNDVYVRYAYDEGADTKNILKGKWLTMQLNSLNAKYDSGIKTDTKPTNIDANEKAWQWKFLETPQSNPDPYAVYLYNRGDTQKNKPISATGNNQAVSAQTKGAENYNYQRFALLSHTSGYYALAVAGTGNGSNYYFLQGVGTNNNVMSSSNAAAIKEETGFKGTSCSFSEIKSQVRLFEDVHHTYTYKIYTKDGNFAVSENQSFGDASENEFMPQLPAAIQTPLMELEDFRYYNKDDFTLGGGESTISVTEEADTLNKQLSYLYGLYDDAVIVRYLPYQPNRSTYRVPNVKGIEDGHIVRGSGSNDAPLGLDGHLPYNIIWYNDNMMYKNGTDVKGKADQPLQASSADYVWKLEGEDPYAIKIRSHDGENNYINSTGAISSTPQTFMLLPKEGYSYGVLAVTGTSGNKLMMAVDDSNSGTDESVSISTTEAPTKFVIFGLSTDRVIYHLMIKKTGDPVIIPYRATKGGALNNEYKILEMGGSTQRDLSSTYQLGETIKDSLYCVDAGHISLGDKLEVPEELYRPNVVYQFFVEGVYDNSDFTGPNTGMNDLYKGLEMTNMVDDSGLLNKTVFINVVYSFNGTLNTNAGADFVRSVGDNKWYTFETKNNRGTPLLTQFTNAWGMEVKEGRGTHYTNDYLWTPLGDPYGFKMYHRYTCVNSGAWNDGEPNRVMTTIDKTDSGGTGPFVEEKDVTMSTNSVPLPDTEAPYSIYELLADEETTPGYFLIHPVANTKEQTQYYLGLKEGKDASGADHTYVRLTSTRPYEFTFGLSEELLKPYYDRAGYVGGLKNEKKAEYKAAADAGNLIEMQNIVYNPDNIVQYTPGYYRLHSPEDIAGIETRYASGYTHQTELTDQVPMHFYEVEGTNSQFNYLKSQDGARVDEGYTTSNATRGDIPIPAVEYDPASIFRFYQVPAAINSTYHEKDNMAILSTQGLYVKGYRGPGNTEAKTERAKAMMTATENEATPLYIMDIGGGILLIHDQQTASGRVNLKYLSFDQARPDSIYDLKLTHNTHTDHAKWLMQPANHLGLRVTTHSGGDGATYGGSTYNYTTFYAPFDVMLPDTVKSGDDITKIYHATIVESANSPWNTDNLHPKSIGRYNIAANGCPAASVTDEKGVAHYLRGNDRFVPAGTPVLIAMLDNSGYIKLTLPTTEPHPMPSSFTADSSKDTKGSRTNILSGEYLEQLLPYAEVAPTESSHRVYTFGRPYNGAMTLNKSTGEVTATLPLQDNSGIGFYLNANPNKEVGLSRGSWIRNNWYVYGNKVYYHDDTSAGSAPGMTRSALFIPVVFDDEDEELQPDGSTQISGDNCVYDLSGRKVATEQQVKDGTWRQLLKSGVYIINGKKIAVSAH